MNKSRKEKDNTNTEKQSLMEKILLNMADCADLSFSYRFKKGFYLPEFPGDILRDLIKKDFRNSVTDLKKLKFIEKKKNYDGSIVISLTDKGRLKALNLRFRGLDKKIEKHKEKWDGKWRMVAFDIPNEFKKGRDALRYRAQRAGFYELQKSLFLYPYDCEKEIKDFVCMFKLEKYVRFALLDFVDNQDFLLRKFKLEQIKSLQ